MAKSRQNDIVDAKEEKPRRFLNAVKTSLIIRALSKFAKKIYGAVAESVFARILTSRPDTQKAFDASVAGAVSKRSEKSVERSKNIKYAFAKQIEKSFILNALKKLFTKLLTLSLSSYGVFVFSFGFYVTVVYAVKRFALNWQSDLRNDLFVGLGAIILSIFLFASKKSLSDALSSSVIMRTVFADMLGLREESVEKFASFPAERYVGAPFVFGTVLGILSFFVHPYLFAAGIVLAVFFAVVFIMPETGLLTVIIALPFLKTTYVAVLIVVTFASYFVKFICGRRVPKFSGIDVPIVMFILMLLSGGVFSLGDGSLPSALVYICFTMGYFLVRWMFGSQKYVFRAMSAVALSATVVSLWGIVEYFIGSPSNSTLDVSLFGGIRGRVTSSFTNPNMLAEFLIMAVPLTFALAASVKSKRVRFALAVSTVLDLACLVLTWSRGAWLGIIIAGVAALLISSKNWLTAGLIAVPGAAAAFVCVDSNVTARLASVVNFSDSSTAYRINIWKCTLKMLGDKLLYGIGVGDSAFTEVFPYYAYSGLINVVHAHNLYLQIAAETGIFSLIIFLAVVFMFTYAGLSFVKTARADKNKYVALGILCAVSALLIQGLTDHVFYNYKICLMFWLCIGLLFAHINAAKDSSDELPREY